MSNIELAQKVEYIPALYYRITDVGVSEAIEIFHFAEIHLNMDAERRALLVLNIEAKSQKLKHYQAAPNTPYTLELKRYMEVYMGFRFDKYEGFETLLNAQIISVLKLVGDMFPSLGRLEIFGAIKYAIKHKPEIVKPYDTKDTISSFTAVYLSQIVRAYIEYKNIATVAIKDLMQQLPEKKCANKLNLQKIRYYRDISMMVLQNVGEYLFCGCFKLAFTEMNYGEIIYKNMQEIGFLQDSQAYKDTWAKWNPQKLTKYTPAMKFGFMKEVIVNEIEKYRAFDKQFYDTNILYYIFLNSEYVVNKVKTKNGEINVAKKSLKRKKKPVHPEMVADAKNGKNTFSYQNPLFQLALNLGFLQDVKQSDFDLSQEMTMQEILEKYGKKIVSIYPLTKEEMTIRAFDPQSHFSSGGGRVKEFANKYKF